MEFVGSNVSERTVDAQRPSFTAEWAGVGALEVLEHAVSVGDEIGRHLSPVSDRVADGMIVRTGGDFSNRVIFH